VSTVHLTVEEKRTATDAVLLLVGEIDMATADDLREATTKLLQEPAERIVLDFGGVTFCDSQGLSVLIALHREVSATGGRLVLTNLGEFMQRLLEITGLRAQFEIA
jgi:anti-anti-sigma factor